MAFRMSAFGGSGRPKSDRHRCRRKYPNRAVATPERAMPLAICDALGRCAAIITGHHKKTEMLVARQLP